MPIFNYENTDVHYIRKGTGQPIVFLHGWGANLDSFTRLIDAVQKTHEVIALDFPGFGKSQEPNHPWNLDDYTKMTHAFLTALNIQKPILLGHSFGGRVSIKLSQLRPLKGVILMNSAGIKPERKSNYYFKVYGYKFFRQMASLPIFKWLLKEPLEAYRELHSSADYKAATPMMKQVLSKVVNEDLRDILPKIAAPTLLIWGDQDGSTPLEDAKIMEALIPDAGLVVYEGVGHFSYLEQPERTITIIQTFLGGLK